MNDLDSALHAIYETRSQAIEPPSPREEVLGIPDLGIAQQRRWPPLLAARFQSLFSATKFVVAGVIVALFGGFLLAGVLTQREDETLPAAATASPSPAATAGVFSRLVTAEIEPGIVRVFEDDMAHDLSDVKSLAITADGTVWAATRNQVFRLGEPGVFDGSDGVPADVFDLEIAHDGTLLAIGTRRIASFDGEAWTTYPEPPTPECHLALPEMTAGGTLWVVFHVDPRQLHLCETRAGIDTTRAPRSWSAASVPMVGPRT